MSAKCQQVALDGRQARKQSGKLMSKAGRSPIRSLFLHEARYFNVISGRKRSPSPPRLRRSPYSESEASGGGDMNEIKFFVAGIPRPGGSKRVFPIRKGGVLTGKFIVTDAAGQANKDWRASVAHEGMESMRLDYGDTGGTRAPLRYPLEIELAFVMPRPKYHFKANGELKGVYPDEHAIKPDLGKLVRSTVDALTHIIWADDAQIVKETHSKAYGSRPGVTVIVREASRNGGRLELD